MKDYLIVVDMQKDFVDGALGSAEAVSIVPKVLEAVNGFPGKVIFTRDTHPENYMDLQEGKFLPVPHCIRGTEGWELIPPLREYAEENNALIFDKPTFGSRELSAYLLSEYGKGNVGSVTFCGVCTDICVISNALLIKAAMPELPVYCIEKACAGVTPEKHNAAIEVMKSCQIQMR